MYTIKIGKEEIELSCKLGVTKDIKKAMGKSYMDVMRSMDKLDIDDIIKFLHCGVEKTGYTLSEFKELVYDNCGVAELYEHAGNFIKKLQYPHMTIEEIDAKFEAEKKD